MEKRFDLLREKILENLQHQWTLEEMSLAISVSVRHLERIIRTKADTTPSVWLRDLRLERAEKLLDESFLNISEICLQIGIRDRSRFARYFKEKFGATPKNYRKT